MFFIVSKLLFFLLVPFNWLLVLLIIFIITKNKRIKKYSLITIAIIFIVFGNNYLYQKVTYAWQINQSGIEPGKHYQAGILLGGISMFDKHGKGYLNQSCDRFTETLKLYQQGVIKYIVVSGGSGQLSMEEPSEADFLQQELIANKVDPSAIFIENKSKNTFENASFSKRVMDSMQWSGPYVLITSALHLRRALKVFDKAGIAVAAYPSSFDVIESRFTWLDYFWPSPELMSRWPSVIKEMVGLAVYSVTGKA